MLIWDKRGNVYEYEEQNKSLCDDLEIEEGSEELFWQSVRNNFKLGKRLSE